MSAGPFILLGLGEEGRAGKGKRVAAALIELRQQPEKFPRYVCQMEKQWLASAHRNAAILAAFSRGTMEVDFRADRAEMLSAYAAPDRASTGRSRSGPSLRRYCMTCLAATKVFFGWVPIRRFRHRRRNPEQRRDRVKASAVPSEQTSSAILVSHFAFPLRLDHEEEHGGPA